MKVRKGVILAAGESTRMRPMTTSVPKPMLPLVDRPIIDYILEEAFSSGIEKIAIVVGYKSEIIKDYINSKNDARIELLIQTERKGTAHAIGLAKHFVGDEPFALFLGDEIVVNKEPCTKQLINMYQKHNAYYVTGLELTDSESIKEYNSVEFVKRNDNGFEITNIIEKPKHNIPSLYTSIGRYVMNSDIFRYYEKVKPEEGKEFYLTEVVQQILKEQLVMGCLYEGKRYDLGNKNRWLSANIELGMGKLNNRNLNTKS